jgi:hypothetical protein
MNKLLIIICFISIFHFSKTQTISNDTIASITDYFIQIVKGMSKNETNQICANAFIEKKKDLNEFLKDLVNDLLKGQLDYISLFSKGSKFLVDCPDILHIAGILFMTKYEIKKCGVNMMNKAKNIDKHMQSIMGKNNNNDIFFHVGGIISDIFGIKMS